MAKKTKKPKRRAIKKRPAKKKKPAKRKIKKTTYKDAVRKLRPRPKRKPKKVVKPRRPKKKTQAKPRIFIGKDPVDQLFESQAKVKLLKLFFRNAEDMFEPKEIFKRLRVNVVLIKQELKKLEKIGVIQQKKAWLSFETKTWKIRKLKRTVYYLNHAFYFINELRSLILKSTVASKDDLMKNIKKVGDIKLLVLAGIFLNDDSAPADLLIVGNRINQRKLNESLKNLEAEVGKELKCAVMNTKEFDYRYDMYDRFTRDLIEGNSEILIQKIDLW